MQLVIAGPIRASKMDPAPGMSGLSHNMLKVTKNHAPDITVRYSPLQAVWTSNPIPENHVEVAVACTYPEGPVPNHERPPTSVLG